MRKINWTSENGFVNDAYIPQYEYSINGSSLWHTSFVSGDLFVRWSVDGGVTWGDGIRFVGEDGTNGTNGIDGEDAPLPQYQFSSNGTDWYSTYTEGNIYMRWSVDGGVTWGDSIPLGRTWGDVTTLTEDAAISKATGETFALRMTTTALPLILGGYDANITLASGTHNMGNNVDELKLRGFIGGNIVIRAATTLIARGTNQTSIIAYNGSGQINAIGLHCNLIFDSIKFVTSGTYNNILANLKGIGKVIFNFCYFDFDLGTLADSVVAFCEGMDVVFDRCAFRESSTLAAQNSAIVELSRGSGEGRGSRVMLIDCIGVSSRPFAYGARGVGEAVFSNSNTAYTAEDDTTDGNNIVVLTNQVGSGTSVDLPLLSNISITNVSQTSATINTSFNRNGFIYYGIYDSDAPNPSSNYIIYGTGTGYVTHGIIDASANNVVSEAITSLNYNHSYKIFIIAEDELHNFTQIHTDTFITTEMEQLTAPTAGTPVVDSESAVTVPITGINLNAVSIVAQFKQSSAGTWTIVEPALATSITEHQFTGLSSGTSYDFRFVAIGDNESYYDSDPSNTVTASTDASLTNMLSPEWSVAGGVTDNGDGSFTFDDVTAGELYESQLDMIEPLAPSTSYTLTFDLVGTVYMRIATVNEGNGAVTLANYNEYTTGARTITFTTGVSIDDGGLRFQFTTDSGSGTVSNIVLLPTT